MAHNIDRDFVADILTSSLGGTWTAVSSPVVALITDATQPDMDTTGSEVSGGSYTRQGFTASTVTEGATATDPSTISNANLISFTGMPECTVHALEIYDGTRRLWWGNLSADKTVGEGDVVSFAIGAIDLSLG